MSVAEDARRSLGSKDFKDSSDSWRLRSPESSSSWNLETSSPRTPIFTSLALDVSYAGLDSSGHFDAAAHRTHREDDSPEYWQQFSVIDYLDKLTSSDDSTPEERVESLKKILAETDIHEGDGIVSEFLFHVAKTKHGKIYIRVIRTMLLNRGRILIRPCIIDCFHVCPVSDW